MHLSIHLLPHCLLIHGLMLLSLLKIFKQNYSPMNCYLNININLLLHKHINLPCSPLSSHRLLQGLPSLLYLLPSLNIHSPTVSPSLHLGTFKLYDSFNLIVSFSPIQLKGFSLHLQPRLHSSNLCSLPSLHHGLPARFVVS
jgi:hypothetical protein